jgi:hypothetical protein
MGNGDIVDSDRGLSYWPARLHSTISTYAGGPLSGNKNLAIAEQKSIMNPA